MGQSGSPRASGLSTAIEGCVVPNRSFRTGIATGLKHIGHPGIKMAAEAALPACRCSNCPSFQDTYVKDPMNFGFQKNPQEKGAG
jgi:hypothetical protein